MNIVDELNSEFSKQKRIAKVGKLPVEVVENTRK